MNVVPGALIRKIARHTHVSYSFEDVCARALHILRLSQAMERVLNPTRTAPAAGSRDTTVLPVDSRRLPVYADNQMMDGVRKGRDVVVWHI